MIKELRRHVEFLTLLQPSRSVANQESLTEAGLYIQKEFENLGYSNVHLQKYNPGPEGECFNVIASYGEGQKDCVVVGAHYDTVNNTPGADDNASAVAALLQLAKMIFDKKPDLDYRIDFVAYSTEEFPYFRNKGMGSYFHAQKCKEEGLNIKAMLCLEMIGYFSDEPGSQSYPVPQLAAVYPSVGDFIGIVGRQGEEWLVEHTTIAFKQSADIKVQSIATPAELTVYVARSDFMNYWEFDYPALMITDTSNHRNPNYHSPTDTIETLNFEKMAEVVKGLYAAMVSF
jgi:Zn-dependent M28 family amino/carboxypeptidase